MGSEPTEIKNDGTRIWRNDKGERHREDGPAVIYSDGEQYWYINGNLHREDGPAVIFPDGEQYWYINFHDVTDQITEWAKDRDVDLDNLTDIDKMVIKLEWVNYN